MSDVMLLGVLRMQVLYPTDAMWLHQFVDRARQAADRIEADAAEIERLRFLMGQVLADMQAQDVLPEWQTLMADALRPNTAVSGERSESD